MDKRRRTKSGEAGPPKSPDNGKHRYNLRSRDVVWVDDDTLPKTILNIELPDEDEDDDEYEEEEEDEEEDEEDEEDDEDEEDEEGTFIEIKTVNELGEKLSRNDLTRLIARTLGTEFRGKPEPKQDSPPIHLSRRERDYFDDLPDEQSSKMLDLMKKVSEQLGETEIPFKFRVLEMETTEQIKATMIRKIETMNRMGADSGEAQKLRVWIEALLRVPFGKTIPLPVTMTDGPEKCSTFLKDARATLDKATYGMESAKLQIMQTIARWISNPVSVGNCIAMRGPAGVGKTSFARNGIANVLKRPFVSFSLGGASDIAHYNGHSYTYEGSIWGRIVDAVIQSKCMNPVMYFDELDKISGTPHGEEITSMLIHLTDRSQNCEYHDRYFAGIDFDLSKCLFVFSYNDESKVNPILKDRMTMIQCGGYKDPEKKIIAKNYIFPDILSHVGLSSNVTVTDETIEFMIKEYSNNEEGMRSMIRIVETVVSSVNLIHLSDPDTAKAYKFYTPIVFPLVLDIPTVRRLLSDFSTTEPETWRSFYS